VLARGGWAVADDEVVDLTHGNGVSCLCRPNAPRAGVSQALRLPAKVLALIAGKGQAARRT
jgi:hypothetical protein